MIRFKPPFYPKEIKIEVTQQCPLNCLHCSSSSNVGKLEGLSFKEVSNIITKASTLQLNKMAFSGGEPLLKEWLEDAVKLCSSLKVKTTIYTTGMHDIKFNVVTEERVKAFSKNGLNKAVFSIYSDKSEVHNTVTRIDKSFDKTIHAIKTFIKNGVLCEIHFVPMKSNFKDLENIYSLAKKIGVKTISVLRFVPQGRGEMIKSIEKLSNKETIELRNKIIELRSKNDIEIRLGSPYNILVVEKKVECSAAIDRIIVSPKGLVYPCDAFKNYEFPTDKIRNIRDNDIETIWKTSPYLKAVRDYLTTDFEKPCKICTYLDSCKSGCLAQKVLLNNCFKKDKDPECMKGSI